jgi:hypothetical protein
MLNKLTIKATVIYFFFITIGNAYSQSIDSTAVAYKAKLFTVSKYGVSVDSLIMDDIQNQELCFLESPSSDMLIMKMKFNQKYFTGRDKSFIELIGTCYYYIAFSVSRYKFYRLGGFDALDIEDFFNDIDYDDNSFFAIDDLEKGEVDFICLLEYSNLSRKKKLKKGFNCFKPCSSQITEYLVIPKKPTRARLQRVRKGKMQ